MPEEASSLTFSPDGRYLVAGDHYGKINAWNVQNQKKVKKLPFPPEQHKNSRVSSLAFNPDSTYFASVSWNGIVHLSLVSQDEKFKLLTTLKLPESWNPVFCTVSFSSKKQSLVLTGRLKDNLDGVIGELLIKKLKKNIQKPQPITKWDKLQIIKNPGSIYHDLHGVSSPDGNYIVFSEKNNLKLWNINNQTKRFDENNPGDAEKLQIFKIENIASAVFSHDSKLLAIGDKLGSIKILEFENGKFKLKLSETLKNRFRSQHISQIVFSHDDQLCASVDIFGSIAIWKISKDNKSNLLKSQLLDFIKTRNAVGKTLLAFWPEEPPEFHLEDPTLQQEKIDLLRDLGLME